LTVSWRIQRGQYHDSITLMQVARETMQLPGVQDAALVMATDANKALLQAAGLGSADLTAAGPNDLAIVVKADGAGSAERALTVALRLLTVKPAPQSGPAGEPRSLRGASRLDSQANIAVISVAGQYAAAEAWEALRLGLHVLLFSDNVSLDDEIALKKYAVEHGLLLMGPGCGTAILNGVALGFANVVPRGPVGIVAAAGTGLQEVSTLLAKLGVGVSQAIGTGGRDLSDSVGGMTMLQGLRALQQDAQTAVLLLISKPPSPQVAALVLQRVKDSDKPTVVCFLGSAESPIRAAGAISARTLEEAAYRAAAAVPGYAGPGADEVLVADASRLRAQAAELRQDLLPEQKYLRGLFSGGTLAAEALVVWTDILGNVYSNVAVEPRFRIRGGGHCGGHCALDLGEEEFTVGRPHPMIDNDLRIRRLLQEAEDPEAAVVVLDVVLGYGAHPDPAGELGPAIERARQAAAANGRKLAVVTSVTGTRDDPQGLDRQVATLQAAGAIVCNCNAAAALLAAAMVSPQCSGLD